MHFFFRYNSKGNPIDCRLLDLQGYRVGSPALDINYLFFTSLNGEVRQEYLNDFLSTYYASFASTLAAAKIVIPFTYDELVKEYYSKNLFGLVNAAAIVPTILMDFSQVHGLQESSDEIANSSNEDDLQKAMTDYRERTVEMAKNNPLIKPRLLSMFDDLKSAGIMGGGSVNNLIKTFNSLRF